MAERAFDSFGQVGDRAVGTHRMVVDRHHHRQLDAAVVEEENPELAPDRDTDELRNALLDVDVGGERKSAGFVVGGNSHESIVLAWVPARRSGRRSVDARHKPRVWGGRLRAGR